MVSRISNRNTNIARQEAETQELPVNSQSQLAWNMQHSTAETREMLSQQDNKMEWRTNS